MTCPELQGYIWFAIPKLHKSHDVEVIFCSQLFICDSITLEYSSVPILLEVQVEFLRLNATSANHVFDFLYNRYAFSTQSCPIIISSPYSNLSV